jgi:hypothetical protein
VNNFITEGSSGSFGYSLESYKMGCGAKLLDEETKQLDEYEYGF